MNSRLILGFILGVIVVAVLLLYFVYYGVTSTGVGRSEPKATSAISGDNVYVAWWTNETVIFRESTMGARETLKYTLGVEIVSDMLKMHAMDLIMNRTAGSQSVIP